MYFFYIFISVILYLIGLVVLIPLSFKEKYKELYKKFFPFKKHKVADIHFHFASFGELRALKELILYYKSQGKTVLLTSASRTGYKAAKELDENTFFLPLEPLLFFWLKPAKTLIVYEAELWLNLVKIYKNHNKKTILLNARIKKTNFKKYYKLRFFYKEIFSNFDFILAQSETDVKRLIKLGAKNIQAFTNIKLTAKIKPSKILPKNKPIIIAASTHEKEEEIILNKLDANFLKDKCLIIAPRHPERTKSIENMLKARQMKYIKYSENELGYLDEDVFLLDTLGELINFYNISDYVILGGSYVPVGGHNFAEAAQFGCKITAGKYVFSQLEILKRLENVIISDEIDFTNAKNTNLKEEYSFKSLCDILDKEINETR